MTRVITYGTYDLLHEGHINILRRAKELGDYLIVGVTSDSFDRGRGKLNVRNNVLERVEAVKATGYADEVIIEDYLGQKIDDIQRYDIDIFAIGSDWKGKFDYLNEYCKVVYLPRTEGISSTMLREQTEEVYRIGIVGSGRIAKRFVPESKVVNSANVTAVFDPNKENAVAFGKLFGVKPFSDSFEDFLEEVDAVYVASPHLTHYDYTKKSLYAGKHVLCEIPFMLNSEHPTGKLTMSFPRVTGQCPIYYNHKMTGRPMSPDAWYTRYVSNYIDVLNEPLYPFGYGLSYTTYTYGDVSLNTNSMDANGKIQASVIVTNTGAQDGEEIVQLYLRDIVRSITPPVQELKGFKRVALKAGESKKVTFDIDVDMLKFYDSTLDYVAEPGEFQVMIGGNSKEVKTASFTLK